MNKKYKFFIGLMISVMISVFIAFSPMSVTAMDKMITNPKFQILDANGDPASGYSVYTYQSGTTTPLTTYSDRDLSTPNSNPITLDSRGECVIYISTSTLKIVVKDTNGSTVWTVDNLLSTDNSIFEDTDSDTQIQVEESSDEDVIRFDIAGTEQIVLDDGVLYPTTDSDVDLGKAANHFKAGYLDSLTLTSGATPTEFSTDGTFAGNSDTAVPTEQAVQELMQYMGLMQRPKTFTYNGGTTAYTIKLSAAGYLCKDKVAIWASELTTTAITTPGADDWYYLYLDYSAITSGTAITNSELIWSNTEPAWSETWKQWMNGNDRAIFAVMTNGGPTNILEFFHEGDYVSYADQITSLSAQDIATDWSTEVTLTIPIFARKANVIFKYNYSNASTTASWRTEGQTGTTGHQIGTVLGTAQASWAETVSDVICSANLKIDVKDSGAATNTLTVFTNGWYFPVGL